MWDAIRDAAGTGFDYTVDSLIAGCKLRKEIAMRKPISEQLKKEQVSTTAELRLPGVQTALVIGASISGLTAARVLAEFVEQVVILDRDDVNGEVAFRRGAPQAHHAHTLLPYGQLLLEKLFPGLSNDLVAGGAVEIDPAHEKPYFKGGSWHMPSRSGTHLSISASRPLIEAKLFQRIAFLPNVTILREYEVSGLHVDRTSQSVAGVIVRRRGGAYSEPEIIQSQLVVDASGRSSQAPRWLADVGFQPPEEWKIDTHVGYATRIYEIPPGFAETWKALYISPDPPGSSRGGVILPIEDNRWYVSLMGVDRDYPPTDETGFLTYARSLPSGRFYSAIKDARPLSRVSGFRRTANRVRRYDRLPVYLEGFLVLGDAAYALNPVYAQGMTAAVLAGTVLQGALKIWAQKSRLTGLAQYFQAQLASQVGRLWEMTVSKEWEWTQVELSDNTEDLYPRQGTLAASPG
jgi:2-polyprenyl-6-methoxyphenol hydroxylase-like FAD-dependent oxidoreductase